MELQILRRLGCGAPLQSAKCSYCNTVHIGFPEPEQETVSLYADNRVVETININTVKSQTECLHRLMQTGSITAREMAYGIKKLGERI